MDANECSFFHCVIVVTVVIITYSPPQPSSCADISPYVSVQERIFQFYFNTIASFYEDMGSVDFSFLAAGSVFIEDSSGLSWDLFLLLFWWVCHFYLYFSCRKYPV